MTLDNFWAAVEAQLEELKSAKSADDVLRILSNERNPYGDPTMSSGDGFFAGGGGDETPYGSLMQAGWAVLWMEAGYYYALRAPDGSMITYIEGDIYRGNRRPLPHGEPADEVTGLHGRCDSCGAACDENGCTTDRSHVAAIDPTEGTS